MRMLKLPDDPRCVAVLDEHQLAEAAKRARWTRRAPCRKASLHEDRARPARAGVPAVAYLLTTGCAQSTATEKQNI